MRDMALNPPSLPLGLASMHRLPSVRGDSLNTTKLRHEVASSLLFGHLLRRAGDVELSLTHGSRAI